MYKTFSPTQTGTSTSRTRSILSKISHTAFTIEIQHSTNQIRCIKLQIKPFTKQIRQKKYFYDFAKNITETLGTYVYL